MSLDKKIRQYIREDITEMLKHYIDKLRESTNIDVQIKYKTVINIPASFYTDYEEMGFTNKTRFVKWTIGENDIKTN